jgi:hypothetical protein
MAEGMVKVLNVVSSRKKKVSFAPVVTATQDVNVDVVVTKGHKPTRKAKQDLRSARYFTAKQKCLESGEEGVSLAEFQCCTFDRVDSVVMQTGPPHVLLPKRTDDVPETDTELGITVELIPQGCEDPVAMQLVQSRIMQQLFIIELHSEDGTVLTGSHMLAIGDTYCFIPYHMVPQLVNTAYVQIYGVGMYKFDISCMQCVANNPSLDLQLVRFSSGFALQKDIRDLFIDEMDLPKDCSNAVLVSKRCTDKGLWYAVLQSFENVRKQDMTDYDISNSMPIKVPTGYSYPLGRTKSGDCGSPLVVYNKRISGKILGLHFAGYRGLPGGFASCVSKQSVADMTRGLAGFRQCLQPQCWQTIEVHKLVVETCEVLGVVDSTMAMRQPTKTDIAKSPLYGCFGTPMTAPAILKNDYGVNPLATAQEKNKGRSYTIPEEKMSVLIKFMINRLRPIIKKDKLRLLDWKETFRGIEGEELVEPINMATSSGYPWVKKRSGAKSVWFERDEDDIPTAMCDELYQACLLREANANNGVRTECAWIDTLKDERRTLDKVAKGKTRMFNNGPVDFTLVFRRYFSTFIAEIQRNRINWDCALGINPHSREWDLLFRRLNSVPGQNWFAGDFSNYDGSIPQQFMLAVGTIVNALYADDYSQVRETLMVEIYEAIHMSGDSFYRVFRGNPSGNPFTTVMNSLVNSMLMAYAWMEVGYSISDFDHVVRMTSYGDDNVLKVHPDFDKFTMSSVAHSLATIGVTYTPASKNGVNYDYCEVTNVTFLKRYFVMGKSEIIFAPMSPPDMEEMLYWYRDSGDMSEAVISTVRSYIIEVFHHGEKYFNKRMDDLGIILGNIGIYVPEIVKPWMDYFNQFMVDR